MSSGPRSAASRPRVRDRVRRLERRQNALEPGEVLEGIERGAIVDPGVLGAPEIAQPRVLGPDGCVIESGRDRVRPLDVAVLVLQHVGARALQDAGAAAREARRVPARHDAVGRRPRRRSAGRLRSSTNASNMPMALLPPPDAGDDGGRQPPSLLEDLPPRLAPDHRLELADHQRVRMRPERRAEQVVRVVDVRDPVAHRLVDGVLQRAAARVDAAHGGAEQLASAARWAPAAPCLPRPCRRRTRARAARRRSRWPRRAARRRSPRRCAACPCARRAAPGRARC